MVRLEWSFVPGCKHVYFTSENGFFWPDVDVTSGTSGASLKRTLDEQQFLTLPHCLIFLDWRLPLGKYTRMARLRHHEASVYK